jgi:putative phosphoribosyl transferase
VPFQRELAAAAVVNGDGAEIVLNDDVLAHTGVNRAYVDAQAKVELAEIERRRRLYLAGRDRPRLEGRDLVLVDDGIATGASVRAAIAALRRKAPIRLILAVPVAARETIEELRPLVDRIVCLVTPEPFHALSLHYGDFEQVSDKEVVRLMGEAADRPTTRGAQGDLSR